MILEIIPVGSYQANCYIVGDEATKEVVIVDPGDEEKKIIDAVERQGYAVKYVTFTHAHFDHVTALEAVQRHFNAPVLTDVASFEVGGFEAEVIKTPGHTPDSVCFKIGRILLSGDTLFYRSVGRCDLPGGDFPQLEQSVKMLYKLPDDTVVYPGHGPATTIGDEKQSNPYIRAE